MTGIPHIPTLMDLYGAGRISIQTRRYLQLADEVVRLSPGAGPEEVRFFSAPGRTELCGNHTDHNNGRVLAAAIDMDIATAVIPRNDNLVRIHSSGFRTIELNLDDLSIVKSETATSAALIRGIAYGLSRLHPGTKISGFNASMHSNVLPGSGLSSSAAFEVLIAAVLSDLWGIGITPMEAAKIGQDSENNYFGKPCGLMDQMACACGSVARIDFADPESPELEILPFDIHQSGYSLAIVSTGGSHANLTADYAAIPKEMKSIALWLGRQTLKNTTPEELERNAKSLREACGDRAFLRAWHFVNENLRVDAMATAIRDHKFAAILEIANESGDSSWKYLQNLYAPGSPVEQGLGIALALTRNFLGSSGACRVHGGGFAGTIQAYIPDSKMTEYRSRMEAIFGQGSVIPLSVRAYGTARIESI